MTPFVCPAANLTPTVVRIVNRTRENARKNGKKLMFEPGAGSDRYDPIPELTPEENRAEIIKCIIAIVALPVVAVLVAFAMAAFGITL